MGGARGRAYAIDDGICQTHSVSDGGGVAGYGWGRRGWRRVVASGVVDRVDREKRTIFGVRRKSSPENFSRDGGRRWPESRTHNLKRLYKVGLTARVESSDDNEDLGKDVSKQERISDIDADVGITLVSTQYDEQMFDDDQDLHVSATAKTPTISIDDVTLAQALAELKHTKPKVKAKGIVFHEPEESTITTTAIPKPKSQDKDYQLAERLQAEEQQELNDKEKATLFMQLLEKRRKAFTRVNIFVDFRTELVAESSKKAEAEVMEGSSKRARTKLEQERSKKQKINDDKETAEQKQLVKIIPNEEGVAIDAIPEDVETLWKLVKAKHGSTSPEGDYKRVLWVDLKVMFEPHLEDEVWKMQQRYKVVRWTLFNSCKFWKTVSKVSDTKDIIKFKLDTQDISYTVDIFRDTRHLSVETLDNPFVAPVNIEIIESFIQSVSYQDEDEIEKMVKGEEDEESYASEIANSMLNDDVDDFGTRIEPESHKENLKVVNDDDKDDKKDEDDKKDDDVEKMDDASEKKDNIDHIDHTLAETHATSSMEIRNEQMQTLIPTPNRSLSKDLSSDKTISKELTATVSPTTATTSKHSSKSKSKRGFTSNKTKIIPRGIADM
nr:hypothetical protein [Tanacetum cinerariifolium]